MSDLWKWGFFKRKAQECLDGDDADTDAGAEEVEWEEEEEVRRGRRGRKEEGEEDGEEAGSPGSVPTSHSEELILALPAGPFLEKWKHDVLVAKKLPSDGTIQSSRQTQLKKHKIFKKEKEKLTLWSFKTSLLAPRMFCPQNQESKHWYMTIV